ncbi:MAG TPA: hypothetical protein VKG45_08555 [Actinomycetes bacterium]|nr:hypothetical protein [Actinomycetes bacterium]
MDRKVAERLEPHPEGAKEPVVPMRQALVLRMQQQAGNRAVQRMLAASGRVLQRVGDPEFTYSGSGIERRTINTQQQLDEAVESLLEEKLDGPRALFMRHGTANSLQEWRDLVADLLRDYYTFEGLGADEVLKSIRTVKDKYREESLLHIAKSVYSALEKSGPLWNAAELKQRMIEMGAYLEDVDNDVVDAIHKTGGKFARTKVQFNETTNIELLDEENVVVLIDHHQQKHQRDKIPQFPSYEGGKGSMFAPGKGLEWHRQTTAPVVKATVQEAVAQKLVTTTMPYAPPKTSKEDGYIYDLIIRYDESTGKWVGSYHCNPTKDEL